MILNSPSLLINRQPDYNQIFLIYAGFWKRFGAHLLDTVLLAPYIGLTWWLSEQSRMFNLYFFVPSLLFSLWFNVYLVKRYGGTPGKLLLKIRIARLDSSTIGYREALLRYALVLILSNLVAIGLDIATLNMSDLDYSSLGLTARTTRLIETAPAWCQPVNIMLQVWIWGEFVIMFTNKRRRALHDLMAGTVVIRID